MSWILNRLGSSSNIPPLSHAEAKTAEGRSSTELPPVVPPDPALEDPEEDVPRSLPKRDLLVTDSLDKAIQRGKEKVERISKECRRLNVRFRDIEFDLEEDRHRCLWGLDTNEKHGIEPADVRRVKDIFEKPVFFAEGPGAGQVVQGSSLEDCWLLAAFSAVSTMPEMLERVCVARDEKVGVYGFIFYMDQGWVDVVIDDQLYSTVPKYVELTDDERKFYKHDQDLYESIARKGSKTLYFTKSVHENETWIPLMEKAYAKLNGDFKALRSGSSAEAVEDLTGGVSIRQHLADILDEDDFWNDELHFANTDRIFTCYIHGVTSNDGNNKTLVNGLVLNHAYSIMCAIEVKGKRFVKLRNPWGDTEWTGRWSDGSKEWTSEWLEALPALHHRFGNDGEFLMQYEDFLKTFTMINRTRLFDASWRVSSLWVTVHDKPFPRSWDYGEVSFTFSIPKATPTIIVLSRNNKRAFADLDGPYLWTFDFKLFRKGERQEIASSRHDMYWARSVPLEIDLEEGDYVVHVRLDRFLSKVKTYWADNVNDWNQRTLARKWALLAASRSLTINHRPSDHEHVLVFPENTFTGIDLTEMEFEAIPKRLNIKTASPPSPSSTERDPPLEPSNKAASEDIAPAVASDVADPAPASPEVKAAPDLPIESEDNPSEDPSPDESPNSDDSNDTKTALTAKDESGDVSATTASGTESPPVPPPQTPATPSPPPPEPLVEHEHYWCDICDVNPIKGPRYRCMDASCAHFDFCHKCFDEKLHNQDHKVVRIESPKESKKLDMTPYKWDVLDDLILGLRVYTKDEAPTTVKGQLRHGKMVRWAKSEV